MLKKFNKEINQILFESDLNKYLFADELLEDAYDRIGFEKFSDLLNNEKFIMKLNNTDKDVLEEAKNSLLEDNIEKLDDEYSKSEALKFYNYLKELIIKKD